MLIFPTIEVASLSENVIRRILSDLKTVAVVGLSREKGKASYEVASYLKEHGFQIVPVNPFAEEILGVRSFKSLLDIPPEIQKTIDIVDIFRPSEDVPQIVEQSMCLKEMHHNLKVIWMQLGIINEQAAEVAREGGLIVIMNKCMMMEHKRLFK